MPKKFNTSIRNQLRAWAKAHNTTMYHAYKFLGFVDEYGPNPFKHGGNKIHLAPDIPWPDLPIKCPEDSCSACSKQLGMKPMSFPGSVTFSTAGGTTTFSGLTYIPLPALHQPAKYTSWDTETAMQKAELKSKMQKMLEKEKAKSKLTGLLLDGEKAKPPKPVTGLDALVTAADAANLNAPFPDDGEEKAKSPYTDVNTMLKYANAQLTEYSIVVPKGGQILLRADKETVIKVKKDEITYLEF